MNDGGDTKQYHCHIQLNFHREPEIDLHGQTSGRDMPQPLKVTVVAPTLRYDRRSWVYRPNLGTCTCFDWPCMQSSSKWPAAPATRPFIERGTRILLGGSLVRVCLLDAATKQVHNCRNLGKSRVRRIIGGELSEAPGFGAGMGGEWLTSRKGRGPRGPLVEIAEEEKLYLSGESEPYSHSYFRYLE